jgi:hypothetical protein
MSDDLFEQPAGNSVAARAVADILGESDSMADSWRISLSMFSNYCFLISIKEYSEAFAIPGGPVERSSLQQHRHIVFNTIDKCGQQDIRIY